MPILAFIVLGLVVAVTGRALLAGKTGMGLVPTVLCGLTGAFLGGVVGILINREGVVFQYSAGVIGGVLGVFFVTFLLGIRARARRRAATF